MRGRVGGGRSDRLGGRRHGPGGARCGGDAGRGWNCGAGRRGGAQEGRRVPHVPGLAHSVKGRDLICDAPKRRLVPHVAGLAHRAGVPGARRRRRGPTGGRSVGRSARHSGNAGRNRARGGTNIHARGLRGRPCPAVCAKRRQDVVILVPSSSGRVGGEARAARERKAWGTQRRAWLRHGHAPDAGKRGPVPNEACLAQRIEQACEGCGGGGMRRTRRLMRFCGAVTIWCG